MVVEPTHLKNMLVKFKHFPNFRGEHKTYLSCHHLVTKTWGFLHFRTNPPCLVKISLPSFTAFEVAGPIRFSLPSHHRSNHVSVESARKKQVLLGKPIMDPWDERHIYLHEWLIFYGKSVGKSVGKYTGPMEPKRFMMGFTEFLLGWQIDLFKTCTDIAGFHLIFLLRWSIALFKGCPRSVVNGDSPATKPLYSIPHLGPS